MGAASGTISGERLVNFDVNVVAPNGGLPISYNRATNSCTLVCHQVAHNSDGSVTAVVHSRLPGITKIVLVQLERCTGGAAIHFV